MHAFRFLVSVTLVLGLLLAVANSCSFTTSTDCSGLGTQHCIGLCDLFKHTKGDDWNDTNNWGQSGPCDGPWKGVTCDNGKVSQIEMEQNNLHGTIPPTLFAITTLEVFRVVEARISGTIPSVHALTALREL